MNKNIQVIIGCEIHLQLTTKTKAFCGCENRFGGIPNTRVCPICLGLPGALPQLNKAVLEKAILAGTALHCHIENWIKFDRKNYTYPDLPKGYQISQFDQPICQAGWLDLQVGKTKKKIGIARLHIEEDAGKNLHTNTENLSYVDFNRSGTPLIEIVSQPEMTSPEEAMAYTQAIREIMLFLGISDGNMEEGSLRCDANVNLRIEEEGQYYATPIVEIKNMNSFKSIKQALNYEIKRQQKDWVLHRLTVQMVGKETRAWDEASGTTKHLRRKEKASDYRYFPEPDLKTVVLTPSYITSFQVLVGELPAAKRERFTSQYGLSEFDVVTLTTSCELCDWFEEAAKNCSNPKKVANWILTEINAWLNQNNLTINAFPLPPKHICELIETMEQGVITGKLAKEVFVRMLEGGENPQSIIQHMGLAVVKDEEALNKLVLEILAEFPQSITDFRAGKDNALQFMMGQLMKKTKGQASPAKAKALFLERLQK